MNHCPVPKTEEFHVHPLLSYMENIMKKIEFSLNGSAAHILRLGMPSISSNGYKTHESPFLPHPMIDDDHHEFVKNPNTWMHIETARIRDLDVNKQMLNISLYINWVAASISPTDQNSDLPSDTSVKMTLHQAAFIYSSLDHKLKMQEDLKSVLIWMADHLIPFKGITCTNKFTMCFWSREDACCRSLLQLHRPSTLD